MSTAIDTPTDVTVEVAQGNGSGAARAKRDQTLTGWAFAAPFTVLFVLFLVVPAIYGLYLSFTGEMPTGARRAQSTVRGSGGNRSRS